jgi:8-hydroxy-5-deazaflavin:NADPH oxidoreductase
MEKRWSENMKIAILGAGNVGQALGSGWAKSGHNVVFGVRSPSKAGVPNATYVRDAAQAADVVLLAVPWEAVPDALRSAGDLTGKLILDATNPLLPDLSGLAVEPGTSGGEKVAALAGGIPVVKIFNTTGAPNMANPDYKGQRATMFYCGDDANAKSIAAGLATDVGFDPVDAGPLQQARLLEPLALLWISLALKQGLGVNIALNLVRR